MSPKIIQEVKNYLLSMYKVKKSQNFSAVTTRNPDNFLVRISSPEQIATYKDIPENCQHIRICYFIWEHKGNF